MNDLVYVPKGSGRWEIRDAERDYVLGHFSLKRAQVFIEPRPLTILEGIYTGPQPTLDDAVETVNMHLEKQRRSSDLGALVIRFDPGTRSRPRRAAAGACFQQFVRT